MYNRRTYCELTIGVGLSKYALELLWKRVYVNLLSIYNLAWATPTWAVTSWLSKFFYKRIHYFKYVCMRQNVPKFKNLRVGGAILLWNFTSIISGFRDDLTLIIAASKLICILYN